MKQSHRKWMFWAGIAGLAYLFWPKSAAAASPAPSPLRGTMPQAGAEPIVLSPGTLAWNPGAPSGYLVSLPNMSSWVSVNGSPAQGSNPVLFGPGTSPAGTYVWIDPTGTTVTTVIA